MAPSDFEKIDQFLQSVGKSDLFEYYSVEPDAPDADVDAAIRKRRGWAQGQQANPRHRQQAMWLIRNNRLLQQTLLEARDSYAAHVREQSSAEGLTELKTFIEGIITVSGGRISSRAQATILERGIKLGLTQLQASELLEQMVTRAGGQLLGTVDYEVEPIHTAEAPFVDYYELLGAEPNATLETLEARHRSCYRRARQIQDHDRASELYSILDQAWRVLSNPEKRRSFDARRAAHLAAHPASPRPLTPASAPGGPDPFDTGEHRETEPGALYPPPPRQTSPGLYRDPARENLPPTTPGIERPAPPPIAPPVPQSSPMLAPRPPISPPTPDYPGEDEETVVFRSTDERPPAPPPGIKRSLPYNTSEVSRRPRLAIASAEMVQVKVGSKPLSRKIIIKNTGKGRMSGRLSSDQSWLEVTRSRLIADAVEQEIEVIIHPRKMPISKDVAVVSVVTDHGDRRAITFRVERRSVRGPVVVGVVGLIGAGVAAYAFGPFGGPEPQENRPSAITRLDITVDPSSDAVMIDGVTVDSGEKISLTSGFPIGTPFVLSVELGGFETATRTLTLSPGDLHNEEISLEMTAALDFVPGDSDVRAELDTGFAQAALKGRAEALNLCFSSNLGEAMAGQTAELAATLYLGSKGQLMGFAAGEKNYEDADGAVESCLTRQLLAVRFPALSGGYFPLEHSFSVPIPK